MAASRLVGIPLPLRVSPVHAGDGLPAAVVRQSQPGATAQSGSAGVAGICTAQFANLNRFLELVPVVAARLVGVQGQFWCRFSPMVDSGGAVAGRSCGKSQGLLQRLAAYEPGHGAGFGTDDDQLLAMDRLVQRLCPGLVLCYLRGARDDPEDACTS